MNFDKVLVLSPHPDDAELGAGGTIARFIMEDKEIFYVTFSGCEKSVPAGLPKNTLIIESKKAIALLGLTSKNSLQLDYEVRDFPLHRQEILEEMVRLNNSFKPDLVLAPSSSDVHQDHQTIHAEALRAFKKTASIWGYEHPWNNLSFNTDVFVKLDREHMEKKIDALKQYKSQDFRTYFEASYIRALAYTRGMQVDFAYAEAFELIRLLVR